MPNQAWPSNLQTATSMRVISGYINYYSDATGKQADRKYSGRLNSGTQFSCYYITYDKEHDEGNCMKITSCPSQPHAENKYIWSPNYNGYSVVQAIDNTSSKISTSINSNGNTTPINANGDAVEDQALPIYVDDAFTEVYGVTYTNSNEYLNSLKKGLRVKDLSGILGMPHQFLPLADPRIDSYSGAGGVDEFGRVYSEKIIKHIPLLLMTPGVPSFMASFSQTQRNNIVSRLMDVISGDTRTINELLEKGSGKYYSLKYAYVDYFKYVNAMLRSAAMFLGIGAVQINKRRLDTFNWMHATGNVSETNIYGNEGLRRFLGPYAGAVAFYADAGTTVDDSFSNSTTESQLASGLNGLSDKGREMNFLIGNVGSEVGIKLDTLTGSENLEANIVEVRGAIDKMLGGGNVIGNILSKAETVLAGGRLVFPEIWSDSSFSRSYSCSMKLVSPSGDKLSVFLNILVPIYHLLAFTLPRQSVEQSYFSPFLVRAHYKGLFNVDMGLVTSLSISKGEEGEWTLDGIPTVANISFEIKDLYEGLFMSKQDAERDYATIMSNIQELDYIANSCGINVNDQEVARTIKMHAILTVTGITDKVALGIFGNIGQYFNQKMNNIFGRF